MVRISRLVRKPGTDGHKKAVREFVEKMGGTREVMMVLDQLDSINPNELLDTVLEQSAPLTPVCQEEIVAGRLW